MQQITVVGLVLINTVLGGVLLWPQTPEPKHFRTLAIWLDGTRPLIGAEMWFDGVVTRDELGTFQMNPGFKLAEVITIEGTAVDPSWARSMSIP